MESCLRLVLIWYSVFMLIKYWVVYQYSFSQFCEDILIGKCHCLKLYCSTTRACYLFKLAIVCKRWRYWYGADNVESNCYICWKFSSGRCFLLLYCSQQFEKKKKRVSNCVMSIVLSLYVTLVFCFYFSLISKKQFDHTFLYCLLVDRKLQNLPLM